MSYDPKVYAEVRQEFAEKERRARLEAETRERELESKIPRVAEIDRLLRSTGFRIMQEIQKHSDRIQTRIEALRDENRALLAERATLLEAAGYPADHSDPKFDCPICHDSGRDAEGRLCECFKTALYTASVTASGIGNLLKTQRFENFKLDYYPDQGEAGKIFCRCSRLARQLDGNLLLMGATGLGKTHLSSAVVGLALKSGHYPVYVTATDLLHDYEYEQFSRNREDDSPSRTDKYRDCDLLVIDDLGAELSTQFTTAALYALLNDRISRGASTLVSTNLSTVELRQRYIDRIASRLLGEFEVRTLQGTDIRQLKKNQSI